jgi:hypothetical protein
MKSRRMRWAGHVAHMGESEIHKNFSRKAEGKRPLERSRRRWENNIKMDVTEIGSEIVDWMHLPEE